MANISTKKDDLTARIIHDLKTPICAQISALDTFLASVGDKISQEEKELIELTRNSCNGTQKLIETFISVNKLSNSSLKLNYERFDIVELIKSSIDELKILLKYNKLTISFDYEQAIIISADKTYIKKVVDNLISNSINYAYKHTLIELRIDIFNGNVLFEIKSNSPYIDKETLKKIFEKYKHETNLYNKSTTSLCLYYSQKIIQAHGGSIIAKSNPDDINVFGFAIPIN